MQVPEEFNSIDFILEMVKMSKTQHEVNQNIDPLKMANFILT